jgi:hypothetical protein
MQGVAAKYLKYFHIDLGQDQAVSLGPDAAPDLLELERKIQEMFGPGHLVCVYEALCVVAATDFPYSGEVDVKMCPQEIYFTVVDFLSSRL